MQPMFVKLGVLVLALLSFGHCTNAEEYDAAVKVALGKAGDNVNAIEAALEEISEPRREGMQFLIAHMPSRDLHCLLYTSDAADE